MLALLGAVILGLAFGYFATQNTTPVTIRFAEYAFEEVPLYTVVLGSLFVGVFFACIPYLSRAFSSTATVYGKDHAVRRATQAAADLAMRVRELEAQNAQLKQDAQLKMDRPPPSSRAVA